LLLGSAVAAVLAIPTAAHAATTQVWMGTPPSAQKKAQKANGDFNAFFPRAANVKVGDSVRFVPVGFHDIDIPKKGGAAIPLFVPTGNTIAGAKDAAGADFWFNGQPELGFNPLLFDFLYGKKVSYNGSKAVISGLPLQDKPKPVTVKFTKKGTYTYFCDVHPGMQGVIKVGAKRTSPKAIGKAVAAQVKSDFAQLTSVTKNTSPPANTIQIGAAGKNGVESYGFFPATSTVPVGTTVTFEMPVGSTEAHTATTGPGNPESEPDSYLGKIAASLEAPQIDQAALYPSDTPPNPASLTASLHGNGFWNSGVLNSVDGDPAPAANVVKFDQAGTYDFYCLIHPFMKTTVTVS
jgi:plastocyanin